MRETWPLLVAVNNRNLAMLIYLWYDFGYKLGKIASNKNASFSEIIQKSEKKMLKRVKTYSSDTVNITKADLASSMQGLNVWNKDHLQCLI